MDNFVHLHLHTQHSLLDGAVLIPKLAEHLVEQKMTACAITEHGWMPSVIDFYKEMNKVGIKPLLGVEAYITEDLDDSPQERLNRDNYHMILIAKDDIGYERLLEAVSQASMHNFYYKPRIFIDNLQALGGHVIATTACLAGVLSRKLIFKKDQFERALTCEDETGAAERMLKSFQKIFGEDLYLEVQVWDDGSHFQPVYNEYIKQISPRLDIPMVLTADCHYIKEEDHKLHELLMAMQLKMTVEEYRATPGMQYGSFFYVASSEEMLKRAERINCPTSYYNTQRIADKCNVKIELGKYRMPAFDIKSAPDYPNFLKWKEQHDS